MAAPDGSVWAGGSDGLLRFDGEGWVRVGLGSGSVPVAVSADGTVWFSGPGGGLYRYRPA